MKVRPSDLHHSKNRRRTRQRPLAAEAVKTHFCLLDTISKHRERQELSSHGIPLHSLSGEDESQLRIRDGAYGLGRFNLHIMQLF